MEAPAVDRDEDRLAQLGYKQELRRDWSVLHNFGVSFSIIVSGRISLVSVWCGPVFCVLRYMCHLGSLEMIDSHCLDLRFDRIRAMIMIDCESRTVKRLRFRCHLEASADPTTRV